MVRGVRSTDQENAECGRDNMPSVPVWSEVGTGQPSTQSDKVHDQQSVYH